MLVQNEVNNPIDISNYAPSLYIVHLHTRNGINTLKLEKKRWHASNDIKLD